MKILIVLFLLIAQLAIAQTNHKLDRKLKRSVKHQKEMVFIAKLPDKDFNSGRYKISKKKSNSEIMPTYLVFQDKQMVAKIVVYNYDIIKITPTKKK